MSSGEQVDTRKHVVCASVSEIANLKIVRKFGPDIVKVTATISRLAMVIRPAIATDRIMLSG